MENKLTGSTNELAKERNRAAAERTMTAWIQNCLGSIGFGFAGDRILSALNRRSHETHPIRTAELAHWLGILFIGLGIGLLIVAMVQHYMEVKAIEREDYFVRDSTPLNVAIVSAIILFGFLGILIILLRSEMLN